MQTGSAAAQRWIVGWSLPDGRIPRFELHRNDVTFLVLWSGNVESGEERGSHQEQSIIAEVSSRADAVVDTPLDSRPLE